MEMGSKVQPSPSEELGRMSPQVNIIQQILPTTYATFGGNFILLLVLQS